MYSCLRLRPGEMSNSDIDWFVSMVLLSSFCFCFDDVGDEMEPLLLILSRSLIDKKGNNVDLNYYSTNIVFFER